MWVWGEWVWECAEVGGRAFRKYQTLGLSHLRRSKKRETEREIKKCGE